MVAAHLVALRWMMVAALAHTPLAVEKSKDSSSNVIFRFSMYGTERY
jgi:hypothetical protein